MKLYTEEQIREVLSNMLLTTEQVESILKELKPQGELKQSPEHIKPGMVTIKQGSTQDPAIDMTTNPKGTDVWKELYERYKAMEEETKEIKEYTDRIERGNKQYFNSTVPLK